MNYLISSENNVSVKDTILPDFHPGIQANMKFGMLSPQLPGATREYLIPYIGRAFHNHLVAQSEDTPSDAIEEAIDLARRALVYYVVYDTIPLMIGNLSNLGFQTMNDREGTSNNPRQWEYYNARRNTILKADKYLDQLLVFLDSNRDDPDFSLYDADAAISYRRSRVFRQVAQLDEYWNIQGSRRAWNTVTPYLNKVEKRNLRPYLGDTLFKNLAAIADDTARTQVQSDLLERCRDYVAEIGLVAAIPHLSCTISGDTIVVVSDTDAFEGRKTAGNSPILRLQQDAETRAAGALQDLRKFLADNAEDIPDYTAPEAIEEEDIIDTPGAVLITS